MTTPSAPPVSKQSLARYGITPDEFNGMMDVQHGVCAGCGRPPSGRRLAVDHKHQRNERKASPQMRRPMVRGLLCYACNATLAKVRDNPRTLLNLANYLNNPPASGVVKTQPVNERNIKQPRTKRPRTISTNIQKRN